MTQRNDMRGFTLIEMSIVLAILGLLTGGILAGKSLIRNAELRSISLEYTRYKTALHQFRTQYNAVPGDMMDATDYWGKDNASCSGDTGTAATPGTCNGDGNNRIYTSTTAGLTSEFYQAWKQLQLANLIEGSYSGLAGSSGGTHHDCPTNCPKGRISNSGWGLIGWDTISANTDLFDGAYGNSLVFGGLTTIEPTGGILQPDEAWNIDTKLDDGKPALGIIVVRVRLNCTNATAAVADSDNFDSVYNINSSTKSCAFAFKPDY